MKQILLLALILLGLTGISAQEKTIEKAEFDKAMSGSYRALMNAPHRINEESVMENSIGSPIKNKIVTEVIGATRRTVFEADSSSSYMKSETIFINGKRFTRKLNNPWTEEKIENKPFQNTIETVSDETIYKFWGEKTLNDKKVKIYQATQTRNSIHKEKGTEMVSKSTVIYYFDESGLMFKSELVSETLYKPKNQPDATYIQKETKSIRKETKTVEIDQNIKIEEPQIG